MKLLGTAPDKQIAARLGCPVRTVKTKRLNRGMRAF
jgi:DNA-directed RNA polymerase specialized sigma24 family protein